MTKHVLAGDVGGTKCNLGIYTLGSAGEPLPIREATFASRSYSTFEEVALEFLAVGHEPIQAAVLGIAGPVLEGAVRTTNLPWTIETRTLAKAIGCEKVLLLNDLEATAYGATLLPPHQIQVLQPGIRRRGNCAVIAAGTGLGQAFLFWDGRQYRASATEGGHADFAPRNEIEIGLLNYLLERYARVSYERILSGPGLANIFSYLTGTLGRPANPQVLEALQLRDPGEVIGGAAVTNLCPASMEAVEIFMRLYGAQAGNLALTVMATGGVYVGGGIVVKLLSPVTSDLFLEGFRAKGRCEKFLNDVPVSVILNPKTAQIGAAQAAADLFLQDAPQDWRRN